MIRFRIFCLLITISGHFSLAQVVPDTTQIDIGDKTIIVIDANPNDKAETQPSVTYQEPVKLDKEKKQELTHFAGIDVGFCQLIDAAGSLTRDTATEWLSISTNQSLTWRFNLLEHKFRIYHDYVGVYTGFAISYNSFGLSNNVDLFESEDLGISVTFPDKATRNYTKNKLRTTVLQVPLMLEINARDDINKNFSLAVGAIGGWVTSTITKQKWENELGKFTSRKKDDFLVNPFTIDLSARIGYKKSALFFTYSLTPLFSKNKGAQVYPITIGIQLIQF